MAHIWVTVCLPPEATDDVFGSLGRALAPFEMYRGYGYREMWDSWRIRGGGEGRGFHVLPGHENDPRLIHDSPRYDGFVHPSRRGECAGGPKSLLNMAVNPAGWADVLTLDGWWVEPDGIARYAGCDHEEPCEHDALCPVDSCGIGRYLLTVPDDSVLVRVYCHG